jgi:hypothetical protein
MTLMVVVAQLFQAFYVDLDQRQGWYANLVQGHNLDRFAAGLAHTIAY